MTPSAAHVRTDRDVLMSVLCTCRNAICTIYRHIYNDVYFASVVLECTVPGCATCDTSLDACAACLSGHFRAADGSSCTGM